MKTGQVFVSHTSDTARFPESRSFVQAALDAVARAGMVAVDMRYFAARDGRPADYCRARVRECEIYVAVVGFRYGSMVPGEAVSYTELEFDTASAAGLPRLVFLLDEAARLPGSLLDADRGPVERFRQRLRDSGLVVRGFASHDGLELEVFHALTDLADSPEIFVKVGSPPDRPLVHTLPHGTAAFTGRDRELRALLERAASRTHVTNIIAISAIDGMAGIGKTAFAVHAAHILAKHFPDGQLFVSLHGHTPGVQPAQSEHILSTLLSAIGVDPNHIPAELDAKASMWRDHISTRRMLIVLDDALDYPQLEPLLPGTGNCLVLVTSRSRLADLTSTYAAESLSLDILTPRQAVKLFRRVTARPLSAGEVQLVERIVNFCGYLPLAISLVAARLAHHPTWITRDLLIELEATQDRLSELSGGSVSVKAAFQLSYQELHQERQGFFRRLSLTPGVDIDTYAAAALNNLSLASARSHLNALYNDHLLEETARGRYRMHDLVHEFSRSLTLADAPEVRNHSVERLLDYYERVAAEAALQIARRRHPQVNISVYSSVAEAPDISDYAKALSWMESEQANLLGCVSYARLNGHDARLVRLACLLADFLAQKGLWEQAITMCDASCNAAERLADRQSHACLLASLGWVKYLTGDCPGAADALESARILYRSMGDSLGEAETLLSIGRVRWLISAYQDAAEILEQARDLYKTCGDRLGEADAQSTLGAVLRETAKYNAAEVEFNNSLHTYRELSSHQGEADALSGLAPVLLFTGRYSEAKLLLEAALIIVRDIGERRGEAVALLALSRVMEGTGDFDAARMAAESSLAINRAIGSRHGQAETLVRMSAISRLAGEAESGVQFARDGLNVYKRIGSGLGEADALSELGAGLRAVGDCQKAAQALNGALAIYSGIGNRHGEAEVLNHLGSVLLALGDTESASQCHLKALDAARDGGIPVEEARSLEGVSWCRLGAGNRTEAVIGFREALSIYERIGAAKPQSLYEKLNSLLED